MCGEPTRENITLEEFMLGEPNTHPDRSPKALPSSLEIAAKGPIETCQSRRF